MSWRQAKRRLKAMDAELEAAQAQREANDLLMEAKIVYMDGTSKPIVVRLRPVRQNGQPGWEVNGFSEQITLPPRARLEVEMPELPWGE